MSMHDVSYQGYGLDLRDLRLTTNDERLNNILKENDDSDFDLCDLLWDLDDDLYRLGLSFATSSNTNAFNAIIYLPNIPPVGKGTEPVKIYTKESANEVLTDGVHLIIHKLHDELDTQAIIRDVILREVSRVADFDNDRWSDIC